MKNKLPIHTSKIIPLSQEFEAGIHQAATDIAGFENWTPEKEELLRKVIDVSMEFTYYGVDQGSGSPSAITVQYIHEIVNYDCTVVRSGDRFFDDPITDEEYHRALEQAQVTATTKQTPPIGPIGPIGPIDKKRR